MMGKEYTHVAFADESSWNKGRYRSIALVSAALENARIFHDELDALRIKHGKSEFKWNKTGKRHGIALADFFFARRDRMRVDVLVWDMEDPRHKDLLGRDDRANFARMYYHLLHNVLKQRWPNDAWWLICPDQQKEVDWLTLEECLGWKSWATEENLFTLTGKMSGLQEFYNITGCRPVSSRDYLLVQLADMFAGLAVYSYVAFEKYHHWHIDQNATLPLFNARSLGVLKIKLSKSDRNRLPILHHVRQEAGKRKMQVSLESSKGLCTKDPKNPLNFWLYVPQRPGDKAPVRQGR